MRVLFKIVLFPISLMLTLLVHVACFLVSTIGGLLNVISFLLFFCALIMFGFAIFDNNTGYYLEPAIIASVVSFLISPYGLPKLAAWFVVKLDDLNDLIKEI